MSEVRLFCEREESLDEAGDKGMQTKVFYFFCESCGGDTAAYELYSRCPYCHADRKNFRLIAESNTGQTQEVLAALEDSKARWTKRGGSADRKKKWLWGR